MHVHQQSIQGDWRPSKFDSVVDPIDWGCRMMVIMRGAAGSAGLVFRSGMGTVEVASSEWTIASSWPDREQRSQLSPDMIVQGILSGIDGVVGSLVWSFRTNTRFFGMRAMSGGLHGHFDWDSRTLRWGSKGALEGEGPAEKLEGSMWDSWRF